MALVLLTKMDLAPVLEDFEPLRAEKAIRDLANAAPVIALSARKGLNLEPWQAWLRGEIASIRATQDALPGNSEAPHEHHHHSEMARSSARS